MNNRITTYYLYLLILLIAQLTLVELFSVRTIKPDLLLIGLIYFTLVNGQISGMITAFIFGLLFDIFSGGVIGASTLSKSVAAFIAGYFSRESNRIDIDYSFFALIFILTLIEKIIYVFIAINLDFKNLIIVLINHGLLPAIVTLIFSLFLIIIVTKREVR